MSTPSRRRLMRDLKRLQEECPEGITAAPTPDNIMIWNAVIFGPEGTPYEDGIFHLKITFDESYPNNPPSCQFLNRLFHPNIYQDGRICLDILQNRWSSTYDVTALLTSIQSLLPDPNPSSPANMQAAVLFSSRRGAYEAEVRKCVEESWAFELPGEGDSGAEDEAVVEAVEVGEVAEVDEGIAEEVEVAKKIETESSDASDASDKSKTQQHSNQSETNNSPRKRSKTDH